MGSIEDPTDDMMRQLVSGVDSRTVVKNSLGFMPGNMIEPDKYSEDRMEMWLFHEDVMGSPDSLGVDIYIGNGPELSRKMSKKPAAVYTVEGNPAAIRAGILMEVRRGFSYNRVADISAFTSPDQSLYNMNFKIFGNRESGLKSLADVVKNYGKEKTV